MDISVGSVIAVGAVVGCWDDVSAGASVASSPPHARIATKAISATTYRSFDISCLSLPVNLSRASIVQGIFQTLHKEYSQKTRFSIAEADYSGYMQKKMAARVLASRTKEDGS